MCDWLVVVSYIWDKVRMQKSQSSAQIRLLPQRLMVTRAESDLISSFLDEGIDSSAADQF